MCCENILVIASQLEFIIGAVFIFRFFLNACHQDKFLYMRKDNFFPGDKRIFEHSDLHICGKLLPRAVPQDLPCQDSLLQRVKRFSKVKISSLKLIDIYPQAKQKRKWFWQYRVEPSGEERSGCCRMNILIYLLKYRVVFLCVCENTVLPKRNMIQVVRSR